MKGSSHAAAEVTRVTESSLALAYSHRRWSAPTGWSRTHAPGNWPRHTSPSDRFHPLANAQRGAKGQRGVTLLEVLVALVIFAFGMLGAAGLQLSALQAAQFAANSGIATGMAREYGELMQMIPAGLHATHNADSTTKNSLLFDTDHLDTTGAAPNACTGSGNACNTNSSTGMETFIASMRNDWAERVKSSKALPQGRAEVCRDSTPRNAAGQLEWGHCDQSGEMVLIKMGWLGKPLASTGEVAPEWMTANRPRFAVSVMANLKDYVSH